MLVQVLSPLLLLFQTFATKSTNHFWTSAGEDDTGFESEWNFVTDISPVLLQPYQQVSSIFSVSVIYGTESIAVPVEAFLDYHVARIIIGNGSVAMKINAPERIATSTISPLSKGINSTKDGKSLLLEAVSSPMYLIIC